jgi:hypothetical protein
MWQSVLLFLMSSLTRRSKISFIITKLAIALHCLTICLNTNLVSRKVRPYKMVITASEDYISDAEVYDDSFSLIRKCGI